MNASVLIRTGGPGTTRAPADWRKLGCSEGILTTSIADVPGLDLPTQLAGYRPQIERHLVAMVHDREAAEDLTQETYGHALAQLDSLRDPKAGLAWLYRIARTPRSTACERRRHPSSRSTTSFSAR